MTNGWRAPATFVAFLAMTLATAHADPDADRCGGTKLKAAGRYGQGLLNCHSKATRRAESVDPDCTAKASGKLADGFHKAESAGGCVTADDEGTTGSALGADVDAIVAALAPDPNDEARACAATKMKGSGKHLRALVACYSKAAVRSSALDPECLTGAAEKLAKSFDSAESKGGCTTVGDLAAIDGLGTGAGEEQVAALSPLCGDAITGPTQDCEIGDDAMCPGICDASCTCVFPPDCGDGTAQPPEECDDGNITDGDGCSAFCVLEDASALCDGVPATAGDAIDAVLVSSGFNYPIHATAAPLDPARLFVVEREGYIRILNLADNTVEPTAFLDINDLTNTTGERGLLSMAFDPNYDTNGRFFVNYTNNSGHTTIARYERDPGDPGLADESTAHVLLVINQPYENHNGGQIAFGVDGYLYVGMGDGGGGGDPDENAQDDGTLLGKMLRIDVDVDVPPYWAVPPTNPGYVDGTSELELIWAKGVRNPWRFSFDRSTGDLVIADVGQGDLEEIDFQAAASTGGENYGWDIFEGTMCFEPDPAPMCPSPPTGFTMPIFEYSHALGCSITGGFVYRGCAMPDLASHYFYSDFCSAFLRTVEISGGAAINAQNRTADAEDGGASLVNVVSFGEDARGEIYILMENGTIYRIEPQ